MRHTRHIKRTQLAILGFDYEPPKEGVKNSSIDSLFCSSPRKSLVKGERFMRCEEKPE